MYKRQLYKELESRFSLRIGISSAHFGVETIALSFEESFKSIKVQKQLNLSNSASSYFEQSIYHILNIPELKDFRKLSRDIDVYKRQLFPSPFAASVFSAVVVSPAACFSVVAVSDAFWPEQAVSASRLHAVKVNASILFVFFIIFFSLLFLKIYFT